MLLKSCARPPVSWPHSPPSSVPARAPRQSCGALLQPPPGRPCVPARAPPALLQPARASPACFSRYALTWRWRCLARNELLTALTSPSAFNGRSSTSMLPSFGRQVQFGHLPPGCQPGLGQHHEGDIRPGRLGCKLGCKGGQILPDQRLVGHQDRAGRFIQFVLQARPGSGRHGCRYPRPPATSPHPLHRGRRRENQYWTGRQCAQSIRHSRPRSFNSGLLSPL